MAYVPPLNGGRINASISGNTTGTLAAISTGTMILAGGNNVTLSQNANTLTISAANQTVQTQNLHNLTIGGNTTGTAAAISSGTLTLAGGNNITLSQAGGNAISIIGGAGAGGGVALYDGAHSITSGTANIVTAGAITASITNQTLSLSVPQTSSVVGAGIVSLSTNAGTVTVSAPAFSAGIASNSTVSNQVLFTAGNTNITLSQATNATGATVSIYGGAGGAGGGVALSASNSSWSSGTVDLIPAGGALTISYSTTTGGSQSINFSVPATSSIVGTNGLSISTAGSTISVMPATVSTYYNMLPASTNSQTFGAVGTTGSMQFFPVSLSSAVAFDALRLALSATFMTQTSTGSQTISHSFGLYSQNGSTLSLISSNSLGYSATVASNSATISYASATGTGGYTYTSVSATGNQLQSSFGTGAWRMVDLQFGGNMTLSAGMYWLGFLKKESSANSNVGISAGIVGNVIQASSFGGFGLANSAMTSNTLLKAPYFVGLGAFNSTNALPGSAAISSINHSISVIPLMTFIST